MTVNVRADISIAHSLPGFKVAQVVGLELTYSHQGAASVSLWAAKDDNAMNHLAFPDFSLADYIVNYFTINNQANLTFIPRSGDKVTLSDGLLYFVAADGIILDFDSGYMIQVARKTTQSIGLPVA